MAKRTKQKAPTATAVVDDGDAYEDVEEADHPATNNVTPPKGPTGSRLSTKPFVSSFSRKRVAKTTDVPSCTTRYPRTRPTK